MLSRTCLKLRTAAGCAALLITWGWAERGSTVEPAANAVGRGREYCLARFAEVRWQSVNRIVQKTAVKKTPVPSVPSQDHRHSRHAPRA
jgi:hypothetical protein